MHPFQYLGVQQNGNVELRGQEGGQQRFVDLGSLNFLHEVPSNGCEHYGGWQYVLW